MSIVQLLEDADMDTKSKVDAPHHAGRGRVFDSIVDTVGDTPIVRLRRLPQQHGVNAIILAKLEYFNPATSVKDRIGAAMIVAMEKAGKIDADTVLIRYTHRLTMSQHKYVSFTNSSPARIEFGATYCCQTLAPNTLADRDEHCSTIRGR